MDLIRTNLRRRDGHHGVYVAVESLIDGRLWDLDPGTTDRVPVRDGPRSIAR